MSNKNKQNKSKGKSKKKGMKMPALVNTKGVNPYLKTNNAPSIPRPIKTLTVSNKQATHKHVCTISDPFCPEAKGKLYPDKASGQRLAYQLRGLANGTSDANGNLCFAFTPTIGSDAAMPGGVCSWVTKQSASNLFSLPAAASWFPYTGGYALTTYGNNVRIVSWGVIIRNNISASASQGTLILNEFNAIPVSNIYTVGTLYGSRVQTKALSAGMEVSWISSPEEPAARNFRTFDLVASASPTGTRQSGEWTSLFVQIVGGAPNVVPVNIEYFINVEVLVDGNNPIASLLPQAPPHAPGVLSIQNAVSSGLSGFIDGGVKQVETTVSNLAKNAMDDFLSNPFALLGL